MNKKQLVLFSYLIAGICIVNFISCSKESTTPNSGGNTNPTCNTFTITKSSTGATSCGTDDGTITVTAIGSNGFMYKLNSSGSYQSTGIFNNLAANTYTVYVKDSAGCRDSVSVIVSSDATSPFTISATTTGTSPCSNTGSISITASGSTGFMYSLNSGAFQANNAFTNLAAGAYTVVIQNGTGCQKDTSITVSSATAGPLFTNVKSLISASCESCHNNSVQNGGENWDNQCNIIANASLIQSQVQSNAMPYGGPPLSASQKLIITNWINAGGGYSN